MARRFDCGKCSLPIGGWDEKIECDDCGKQYHLNCLNMNPYQLRVCVEFDNVVWLCDDCLCSFRKQHSPPTNQSIAEVDDVNPEGNIEHTVHLLQSEFATLKQSFVELKQTLECGRIAVDNPVIPSTSTPQRSSRRENIPSLHLNDTSQLHIGSNSRMTSAGYRKYWIFFTRVARHVSTKDIQKMVCDFLQLIDQPEVVKLVPRWSNMENLRYVSFKVGVDRQYKEKCLMESTWPVGLLYREFEHRESCYWEP